MRPPWRTFTTSIQLDPNNAAAYFNRGVAYFVVGGRTADALADFKKASALNPKDDYSALWQDIAEHRDRMPGHLTVAAKQLDMTAWPAPVVREFLGESDSAQTLFAAYDNDPKTRLEQTCEANFYGGEFALLKKADKKRCVCSGSRPAIARRASSNRQPQ